MSKNPIYLVKLVGAGRYSYHDKWFIQNVEVPVSEAIYEHLRKSRYFETRVEFAGSDDSGEDSTESPVREQETGLREQETGLREQETGSLKPRQRRIQVKTLTEEEKVEKETRIETGIETGIET